MPKSYAAKFKRSSARWNTYWISRYDQVFPEHWKPSGRNVLNPARVSRQDTRLVARWAGPRIRLGSRLRFLLTQLFRTASRRVWSAPWPAHLRIGRGLRPPSRLRLPFAQPRTPEARRVPVRYQKTKGSDPPPERWQ